MVNTFEVIDDIMEEILSYLPIRDKFRLESTSNQFQTLIFNKQTSLRHNTNVPTIYNDLNKLLLETSNYGYKVNCIAFETVLKKCINLDTIILEQIQFDSNLILTISDNCPKLKNLCIVCFYFDINISDDCLKKFALKCGSSLQSLRFYRLPEIQLKLLISSLPELRSVAVDNIKSVIIDSNIFETCVENSENLPILLPKLQEIEFRECNAETLNQLQLEYSNNLLKIFAVFDAYYLISDTFDSAIPGFGNFRRLKSLHLLIDNNNSENELSIDTGLRQLCRKCVQLKRFRLNIFGNFQIHNIFSMLSSVKSLSSLVLTIYLHRTIVNNPFSPYGSISHLRHLSQLKHLSLDFAQLSENHITNISEYLPKLVSISLDTNEIITDRSLKYLSQMKFLSKLEIRCSAGTAPLNITDSGVEELIDGCPLLKGLTLYSWRTNGELEFDFDITEQSIESMIERSEQNPRIRYKFCFNLRSEEKWRQLLDILKCLPPNLYIRIN